MSIRSLFGLCDHRWKSMDGMVITKKSYDAVHDNWYPTGMAEPRECEKCGAVRSFPL